jgi:hypothetical protein
MAERIVGQRSVFDVSKWEQDFKKSRIIQKVMGRMNDPERIQKYIEKGRQSLQILSTFRESSDGSIMKNKTPEKIPLINRSITKF